MINYNDAEEALRYLVGTDEEAARAKVLYEGLYQQRKTIRAIQFLNATGSAAERTEKANASIEYQEHLQLIKDAQIDFEILKNKRDTNIRITDMWRSVNSNQKKGNI
jgi:hypothetical protein